MKRPARDTLPEGAAKPCSPRFGFPSTVPRTMRRALFAAVLFSAAVRAEPPAQAEGTAPAKSPWTGGVTVMWGEGGPHADTAACCLPTSVDGYAEVGHRFGESIALVVFGLGELGVVPQEHTYLASGGLALRLIGDRLGGLAAPLELGFGVGAGHVIDGETPLNVLTYELAFVDTILPVTRYLRVHSQLVEHFNYLTGSAFLTAGIGVGLTFE
jgi:hypothetical protein